MTKAKVFMNGRSQAIRLPKEFRVSGDEVFITRENNKIVIFEKPKKTWAEIFEKFEGDPNFSVHRELINDKPRKVNL